MEYLGSFYKWLFLRLLEVDFRICVSDIIDNEGKCYVIFIIFYI